MKRSELTISALLVPLDYLALLVAATIAYRIRFEPLAELRPITFALPYGEYLQLAAAIAAGWIIIFAFAGLYATNARRRWTAEFNRIVLACSTGFAFVLAVNVFARELFASRFIILAIWPLTIALVFLVRLIIRAIERRLFLHGIGVHRIALIGTGRAAEALEAAFSARPGLGLEIVKRFDHFGNGAPSELVRAWEDRAIDEIIDATTPPDRKRLAKLLDFCADRHIPIRYAADLATTPTRVAIETFAGVPLLEPRRTPLEGWGRILKRTFDILLSTVSLIILSPLLIAIAIAIRIDSRGPMLFRQERIGHAGRPFTFLKFRSMQHGAHAEWAELRKRSDRSGIIPKIKNDPRVTRVGRFLRRWSFDELPQLWNVLRGDMSLVGPRPHLPEEVADYERHHRAVLALRPGLSGLAQVSGRADLDFEEEVQLDTFYIEHWSLGMDLVILLRTPFAVIRTKGAY